jgi:LPXTG-site transpeptidase (sortase) family protein
MSKSSSSPSTQPLKPDLVNIYRRALLENVSLDNVDKKVQKLWQRTQVTEQVETADTQVYEQKLKRKLPAFIRYGALLLPVTFISAGLFLLGNAVIPIAGYYAEKAEQLAQVELTTPIPADDVLDIVPTVIAEANTTTTTDSEDTSYLAPTIIDTQLDYTNLSNWFGTGGLPDLATDDSAESNQQTEYVIDIPKVDVHNAKVVIGGTDLNSSLIQYPGTAMPGQAGSPVIFGHSVLRQFYNPSEKNPRRYTSIFSKIMTLKPGDDIYITENNVKYHYKVKDKTEVKPEDVFILTQNYDARDLKLVTCTPEGTYLRRGVITAQLVTD